MEEIEITSAHVDDASEILNLQKLAYRSEAEIYNDWSIAPLHQTLDATASWGITSSRGNYEVARLSLCSW